MSQQYKVGSGLDVAVEAVDTTPSVPSFKQHTWSFLPSRRKWAQSGYLGTTAQAGADADISLP